MAFLAALLPALIGAAGSMGSAYMANKGKRGSGGGGRGSGGYGGNSDQYPVYTPQQMGLIDQIRGQLQNQGAPAFGQGLEHLQGLLSGSPESTAKFEAPLMRQFNEQIIPGIAERFGGAGAQSSSGFQQALGGAGAGLSERLGALRSQAQLGAASALPQYMQSMTSSALAPQFGYNFEEKSPGAGGLFGAPLLQALAKALGGMDFGSMFGGGGKGASGGQSSPSYQTPPYFPSFGNYNQYDPTQFAGGMYNQRGF